MIRLWVHGVTMCKDFLFFAPEIVNFSEWRTMRMRTELTLASCTTCRQTSWSCTGHPGHIELPVHVYNVTHFDQLYRLLKGQCVYCHRFQMTRFNINTYTCKLRLLQYGLVDEVAVIDSMAHKRVEKKKTAKDGEGSSSEDEDDDDIIERRNSYVKKCIRQAQADGRLKGLMAGAKNPLAAEQRRALVREFFKDIGSPSKCASCSGYVVTSDMSEFFRGLPTDPGAQNFPVIPERSVFENLPKGPHREIQTSDGASWISDTKLSGPFAAS